MCRRARAGGGCSARCRSADRDTRTTAAGCDAAGTRYLAQLKLQGFSQGSKDRFGFLGLRLVETQYADVRVFLQIWDTRDGSIAWEGMQELRISLDSTSDQPVMLRELLRKTAQDLVARLP